MFRYLRGNIRISRIFNHVDKSVCLSDFFFNGTYCGWAVLEEEEFFKAGKSNKSYQKMVPNYEPFTMSRDTFCMRAMLIVSVFPPNFAICTAEASMATVQR